MSTVNIALALKKIAMSGRDRSVLLEVRTFAALHAWLASGLFAFFDRV